MNNGGSSFAGHAAKLHDFPNHRTAARDHCRDCEPASSDDAAHAYVTAPQHGLGQRDARQCGKGQRTGTNSCKSGKSMSNTKSRFMLCPRYRLGCCAKPSAVAMATRLGLARLRLLR